MRWQQSTIYEEANTFSQWVQDGIDKRWDIRWSSANVRFSNNIAEGWIHDVVHSDLGYASVYYSTDNENMMKDWGTRTSQEGFPNWDWL